MDTVKGTTYLYKVSQLEENYQPQCMEQLLFFQEFCFGSTAIIKLLVLISKLLIFKGFKGTSFNVLAPDIHLS